MVMKTILIFFGVCVSADAQSCPTLCDPMDYSPPGSSVYGIFQARILEWVAISSSFPESGIGPHLLHWQANFVSLSHLVYYEINPCIQVF